MRNYFMFVFGFQNPATPIMEGIIDLHNYIFIFLTAILIFVVYIMINILYYFFYKINYENTLESLQHRYNSFAGNTVTHGTIIEIIWTLIPSFILMAIAIPSFALLYSMDEVILPGIVIKVIGHQWYWSYEYADYNYIYETNDISKKISFKGPKFDSYMIPETELKLGERRLLETDNIVNIPTKVHVKMLITGSDVLHSWAVPALGIKVDAVPGRLSQSNIYIKREGIYYGQCSEICGVNHGFMPITINAQNVNTFLHTNG